MIAQKISSKEDLLIELKSLFRRDKSYHLYYSLFELIRTNRVITAKAIAEVGFMPLEISNDLEFEWGKYAKAQEKILSETV
ncbi:MAG: hypothetical protein QNJ55_23050 [Xenococcus sp. MO_188.B8]|nr:hypothetical protein [Xenococcus sp. MO_188.B8]